MFKKIKRIISKVNKIFDTVKNSASMHHKFTNAPCGIESIKGNSRPHVHLLELSTVRLILKIFGISVKKLKNNF